MSDDRDPKQKEIDLRREVLIDRARSGKIIAFTTLTKPDYEVNWHHLVMGRFINRFIKKEIKRLMIFCPPRNGKSELTSRRLPALLHGLYPNDEILHGSYNSELASDFTTDVQRIMDDPIYREIFPEVAIPGINQKMGYERGAHGHELIPFKRDGEIIKPRGSYYSAGLGGTFTGRGANWILLDDLIKSRKEAESKAYRDACGDFYTSAVRTRLEGDASILLTMTLWHQDDIAGRLLKVAKENPAADQWTVCRLPAIREDDTCEYDPRLPGDPLWPKKFPLHELEAQKASSPARDWASLFQQRPTIDSGNIFKRNWWGTYENYSELDLIEIVQFWDTAQKPGLTNDFSVCATWARTKIGYLILDVWRGRVEAPDLERRAIAQYNLFRPTAVVIEDKSSGSSLIQNLQRYTAMPILKYEPRFDKTVRATAAAPTIESGKVCLPRYGNWVETFIAEHEHFPGEHDDQVDTTSMAVDFFNRNSIVDPNIRTL